MPGHTNILQSAADLAKNGTPFVLISVIDTKGHTPRNAGAKMIWRPDASGTGTVGGGQFEQLVLDSAGKHFDNRSCGKETFVLGAEAEQCCGGTMEVFYEFVGPRQRVVIFGAGHVSGALVKILTPAGFEIVVVDDRPDWNSQERFPNRTRLPDFDEGVEVARQSPAATLACVMTCSHETDHEIMLKLLADPDTVPRYTGLIGSRTKRASFFTRLSASGIDQSIIERIHCPIGLGDMGKEPELVAVSIAGQILLEAKKLGAL